MHQFTNGTDQQFTSLYEQSQSACIRYTQQQLPSGCTPSQGAIGFERAQGGRAIKLLVETGVAYSGSIADCAQWLRDGEKTFPDERALMDFCRVELPRWLSSPATPLTEVVPRVVTRETPETDLHTAQLDIQRRRNERHLVTASTLLDALSMTVHGQVQALTAVSARASAHLNRTQPKRPATLFFVGPTGVGKTRTAEQLAEVINDASGASPKWRYLRLDMNEYRESHRVSQLLGSPQGYAGYGEGAQLTKHLSLHPKSIVLFDEIEKAHPDIFLTLMNAMDSGRLSSPSAMNGSNEIDCRKAIFVFTSNLDASGIVSDLSANPDASNEQVATICRQRLAAQQIPPELIGRISTFAVFKPLSDEGRLRVVLSGIADVASEYGLRVRRVAPEVLSTIVDEPENRFGARSDEYRIDALLGMQLAEAAARGTQYVEVLANPLRVVDCEAVPAQNHRDRLPANASEREPAETS